MNEQTICDNCGKVIPTFKGECWVVRKSTHKQSFRMDIFQYGRPAVKEGLYGEYCSIVCVTEAFNKWRAKIK